MKLTCEKEKLVEALSNVQRAVSQKSTIAALEGILIKATDSKLELCGYNTELGITTVIPATVTSNGTLVLNARLLTEIVRKLPGDVLEIFVEENLKTTVTCGQSKFELIGIDAEEFPTLPEVENARALEVSVEMLRSMIRQTIFSVSEVDTKPIHTGTLFEIKDKTLTLVSVDGYRLALRKEPIKEDLELNFVVPGKTLREVFNPLENQNEIKVGDIIYRENDKVLQLVNNPDINVYNGDIGYITKIDKTPGFQKKENIIINFEGTYVTYTKEDMKDIIHAYAITIHKSQGSEFPHVIMPVERHYQKMLYNKLIYTGVSRAKKSLVIIGESDSLKYAIQNNYSNNRKTDLQTKLLYIFRN